MQRGSHRVNDRLMGRSDERGARESRSTHRNVDQRDRGSSPLAKLDRLFRLLFLARVRACPGSPVALGGGAGRLSLPKNARFRDRLDTSTAGSS